MNSSDSFNLLKWDKNNTHAFNSDIHLSLIKILPNKLMQFYLFLCLYESRLTVSELHNTDPCWWRDDIIGTQDQKRYDRLCPADGALKQSI